VTALLREAFGFASLAPVEPAHLAERVYPLGFAALAGRVPVVVAPAGAGLDALLPELGDGSRRRSAFGLAQEYLNAAEDALWGLASDGLELRVLRDNASLTRPAWLEADLARIFTEQRYADFAALWLLIHETRFGHPNRPAADCALESWRAAGREQGTRARDLLRRGVEEALAALGQGFLAHPENQALRAALETGTLDLRTYFQQLLRLVYRLIFLLTAEERGLLHPPPAGPRQRELYEKGYGLRQLRERSRRRNAHDRHRDLWDSLSIVFRGVATGEPRLALPALGGLFASGQCPALDGARLENRALLAAVFRLCWLRGDSGLERVNWRDMGPEELGSVYESLLELVPRLAKGGREFGFAEGGETLEARLRAGFREGRVRRRAGESAVGADQAAGAGVLRQPRPGGRPGAQPGRAAEEDRRAGGGPGRLAGAATVRRVRGGASRGGGGVALRARRRALSVDGDG
jgi:hypothetical protein